MSAVVHKNRNKKTMRLSSMLDARDAFQRALALSFFLAFCSFYAGSPGVMTPSFENGRRSRALPALWRGRARN